MTECLRPNCGGIARQEQRTLALPGGKPVTRAFDAEVLYDPARGEVERYVIVTDSRRSKTKVWRFYPKGRALRGELRNHLAADRFSFSTFEANSARLHLVMMAHNQHSGSGGGGTMS